MPPYRSILFRDQSIETVLSRLMGVDYVVIGFDIGSTTINYPQCSLTFMRERCLHRCREQSFAIRAYAMSADGIDVVSYSHRVVSTVSTDIVSSHKEYCRIAYGITR